MQEPTAFLFGLLILIGISDGRITPTTTTTTAAATVNIKMKSVVIRGDNLDTHFCRERCLQEVRKLIFFRFFNKLPRKKVFLRRREPEKKISINESQVFFKLCFSQFKIFCSMKIVYCMYRIFHLSFVYQTKVYMRYIKTSSNLFGNIFFCMYLGLLLSGISIYKYIYLYMCIRRKKNT